MKHTPYGTQAFAFLLSIHGLSVCSSSNPTANHIHMRAIFSIRPVDRGHSWGLWLPRVAIWNSLWSCSRSNSGKRPRWIGIIGTNHRSVVANVETVPLIAAITRICRPQLQLCRLTRDLNKTLRWLSMTLSFSNKTLERELQHHKAIGDSLPNWSWVLVPHTICLQGIS